MDLVASYSSDEDESPRLPPVPSDILNRFSKTPRLSVNNSGKMTSFIYYDWKLSKHDYQVLQSALAAVENAKSLLYDDRLKLVTDLHISLSYNFKIDLSDFDTFVTKLDQIFTHSITLQLQTHFTSMKSITSDKIFLVLLARRDQHLSQFIAALNDVIKSFDPDYTGYDPQAVHCSIAELEQDHVDCKQDIESIQVVVDRVSLTKGRTVQVVYS